MTSPGAQSGEPLVIEPHDLNPDVLRKQYSNFGVIEAKPREVEITAPFGDYMSSFYLSAAETAAGVKMLVYPDPYPDPETSSKRPDYFFTKVFSIDGQRHGATPARVSPDDPNNQLYVAVEKQYGDASLAAIRRGGDALLATMAEKDDGAAAATVAEIRRVAATADQIATSAAKDDARKEARKKAAAANAPKNRGKE